MAQATSPFLDVKSFTAGEEEQESLPSVPTATASPFLNIYEMSEWGDSQNGPARERQVLAAELHSDELDEALFEALADASELYEQMRESGDARAADRALEQHFAGFQREVDQMLDAASERFAQADLKTLDPRELETFLDAYAPRRELSPAFEQLFGGIMKAIKKVGGAAIDMAKKGVGTLASMALGKLLARLKPVLQPIVKRVLQTAISHLPENLRPMATQVAKRYGLAKMEDSESVTADAGEIQHEFLYQVAEVLYAPGEVEGNLETARFVSQASTPAPERLADLDRARDELADRLSRLKEGEDPGPAFEQFLPLLPVLKGVVSIAGRDRVVGFLARLLSPMLSRFTGPQYGQALSRAIVDTGLKLVSLEATPEDASKAATSAVISTVEDTARRISLLPEYVLEDQELFEGAALEAFEQAAAANLPPVLGQDTYRARPDLRESTVTRGTWIACPVGHRHRYKKFSRVLRTRITPEKAQAIDTFGGSTLAEFLEEQLGQAPGADLEANVHLYESMPGTLLPELARMEHETPGLGTSAQAAYGQLHPLTPQAAGTLLGEPGLGRPMTAKSMAARSAIAPGQRFYYVSAPGTGPAGSSAGPRRLRRHSSVKILLDFKAAQIGMRLYLAETRAQSLMLKLRQQGHVGVILANLRPILERKFVAALAPRAHGAVKIIHPDVAPQQASGAAMERVPAALSSRLRFHLLRWTLHALKGFLKDQAGQVLAAIESPQDGITFTFTFHDPPLLPLLRDVLAGKAAMPPAAPAPPSLPKSDVTVAPGYVDA